MSNAHLAEEAIARTDRHHFCQAQIEELENAQTVEPRGAKRPLLSDELDVKPDVAGLELAGKRLKLANVFDGGFVDLACSVPVAASLPPQVPVEEEDLKPDIAGLIAMGEKLVKAKKQDDGFVDLASADLTAEESQLVSQPA